MSIFPQRGLVWFDLASGAQYFVAHPVTKTCQRVTSTIGARTSAIIPHFPYGRAELPRMRRVALIVAFLLLSGCAFIDQRVSLKYMPEDGGATPPTSETPMTLLTRVNVAVKLDRKADNSYVIGNVKNGYGMTTADTITSDNLDDWVVAALTAELQSRGFKIQRMDQFPSAFDAGVSLVINRVWVEQDAGFWTVGSITQIILLADLYSRGELVKKVSIEGAGDSRSIYSSSGDREESLQKAMRAVMAQLVPEILALRK